MTGSRRTPITATAPLDGGPIRRTAPLTCPACDHEFAGLWIDEKTGDQQCPACGHGFEAIWPGFHFEPETVIARPQEV